jgi:hypothetical protein
MVMDDVRGIPDEAGRSIETGVDFTTKRSSKTG